MPQTLTLLCLAVTSLIMAYLIGHKKGVREGVELGKAFSKLDKPTPSPTIEQLRELLAPLIQIEQPSVDDSIRLDNYSVARGGVIFRGGLEVATIDEESPFEFEMLYEVQGLRDDFEHCRRLSRLWFEKFGVDAGVVLRDGECFVSKSGLFWKRDFVIGRLGSQNEFEKLKGDPKFYLDPSSEDVEACGRLAVSWREEFHRSTPT